MNKLIVTKAYINNFSVATVKDFEGCPEALKMLYQRYGDEKAVLSSRKSDFIKLSVEDNKPHWAINFLLNLMKEQYRIAFIDSYYDDLFLTLGSKDLVTACQKAFLIVKKNKPEEYKKHTDIFETHIKRIEVLIEASVTESERKILYNRKFICQSVLMLLRDEARVLTRSVNSALSKVAEAQSVMDMDNAQDNAKMKAIALNLIEYSEVFEDQKMADKFENDNKRTGLIYQENFKASDDRTVVKINGHDVLMKDYMEDPKKFNKLPFKDMSPEEVISECKKNLQDKKKYSVKPAHYDFYKQTE